MLEGMKLARDTLAEYYKDDAPVLVLLDASITKAESLESALACEIEAEVFEIHVLPALRRFFRGRKNVTHVIKQNRGGSGMEGWIQPECSCGWVGIKEYAHNDYQYSNVVEQEQRHLKSVGRCVKCGGSHPSYQSCSGPSEPPRPAGHHPKA